MHPVVSIMPIIVKGFVFRYGSGSCWLRGRREEEEGGRGRKLAN
jgi:hypothetical protein